MLFDDIGPFVLALNYEIAYEMMYGVPPELHGDINGSGNHDFDDIDGFVALLFGGSVEAVPEPSSLSLACLAVLALAGCRIRRRGVSNAVS